MIVPSGGGQRVRTDSTGAFVIRGLRPGRHQLQVRKIQYRFHESAFVIRSSIVEVSVVLTRLQPMLDTVRARVDQNTCAPSSLDGFECRRLAGIGFFRDAGEIRSLRPEHWADMFDGMPGIRRVMVPGPYGYEWRIMPQPSRCLVELWNGQLPMQLAAPELGGFPPDRIWRPIDVVAIEYYDRRWKIPARYHAYVQPPCDQLVIYWLRGATRRAPPQ